MSTTPKCPHCNARGIDSLAVEDMRMFLLVYCHKCGSIHGVVPNPPQPPPVGVKTATEEKRPAPKIINIDPQPVGRSPKPGVSFPNRPPESDQPATKPVPVVGKNGR